VQKRANNILLPLFARIIHSVERKRSGQAQFAVSFFDITVLGYA
jgi:hypothetical protein